MEHFTCLLYITRNLTRLLRTWFPLDGITEDFTRVWETPFFSSFYFTSKTKIVLRGVTCLKLPALWLFALCRFYLRIFQWFYCETYIFWSSKASKGFHCYSQPFKFFMWERSSFFKVKRWRGFRGLSSCFRDQKVVFRGFFSSSFAKKFEFYKFGFNLNSCSSFSSIDLDEREGTVPKRAVKWHLTTFVICHMEVADPLPYWHAHGFVLESIISHPLSSVFITCNPKIFRILTHKDREGFLSLKLSLERSFLIKIWKRSHRRGSSGTESTPPHHPFQNLAISPRF